MLKKRGRKSLATDDELSESGVYSIVRFSNTQPRKVREMKSGVERNAIKKGNKSGVIF